MSKQAQSWFRHAREDLMGAEYNLKGPDECLAVAGFLAQQSVEKAIKGFLVLHRKRFTKTHNISTLLEILEKVDSVLAEELVPSHRLTNFAVKYRYPEAVRKELTRDDVAVAVKIAKEACALILKSAGSK